MTGLTQETYLPEASGDLAPVYDFLQAHEAAGRGKPAAQYFLSVRYPASRWRSPAAICSLASRSPACHSSVQNHR